MKKIFALGVSGLFMLGAASNAAAYFEAGNLTMGIYDNTNSQELGVDLGAITDLSATNQVLASGLDWSGFDATASGIGVFAAIGAGYQWDGYYATTSANFLGTAQSNSINTLLTFADRVGDGTTTVTGRYNTADGQDGTVDGIGLLGATLYSTGYNGAINATYAGLNPSAAFEANLVQVAADGFVDMYLYHVANDVNAGQYDALLVGTGYEAVIRLTDAGEVILNPNDVPVPGAVWLLGSGLLGLAGVRRRKNS